MREKIILGYLGAITSSISIIPFSRVLVFLSQLSYLKFVIKVIRDCNQKLRNGRSIQIQCRIQGMITIFWIFWELSYFLQVYFLFIVISEDINLRYGGWNRRITIEILKRMKLIFLISMMRIWVDREGSLIRNKFLNSEEPLFWKI